MEYMEVLPDPAWHERISAGWAQFAKDLAEYVPVITEAKPVGRTPETLPALRIEVTGMVTASNLQAYRDHALEFSRASTASSRPTSISPMQSRR
jgi:predicted phage-related endonuclease